MKEALSYLEKDMEKYGPTQRAKKAKDALTTEDVRGLISQGVVVELPKTGVGRGKAKIKQARKQAGRR